MYSKYSGSWMVFDGFGWSFYGMGWDWAFNTWVVMKLMASCKMMAGCWKLRRWNQRGYCGMSVMTGLSWVLMLGCCCVIGSVVWWLFWCMWCRYVSFVVCNIHCCVGFDDDGVSDSCTLCFSCWKCGAPLTLCSTSSSPSLIVMVKMLLSFSNASIWRDNFLGCLVATCCNSYVSSMAA